jgi:hypothetical protein
VRSKVNSVERPGSDDLRRAVHKLMAARRSGTLERSEWEAAKGKLESVLAEPADVPYRGVLLISFMRCAALKRTPSGRRGIGRSHAKMTDTGDRGGRMRLFIIEHPNSAPASAGGFV